MKMPDEIEALRERVQRVLDPIDCAIKKGTNAEKDFLFTAVEAVNSTKLPEYYLIFFLFSNLLGYKNLGQFEKVSWSFPIDYNGIAYLVEYRKFGVGIFASKQMKDDPSCKEIAKRIHKAVKTARPYFEWLASEAAKKSELNVLNHSLVLFERFDYLLQEYKKKNTEAEARKNEAIRTQYSPTAWGISYPYPRLRKEAEWLALSAIDAFYSFTEHVFLHAAILNGHLLTGENVADFADNDWGAKFKLCLDIRIKEIKSSYDELILIKQQIRNFMAHGAFGRNGETFEIHSKTGAVPLLMPHQKGSSRFSIQHETSFQENEAISAIERFNIYYWDCKHLPEIIHIKSGLPTVLTYAADSTYATAMQSSRDMELFVDRRLAAQDRAWNMDW